MAEFSLADKNYFRPLTGIRCIAAYLVYIHHYNPFNGNISGKSIAAFANEFHVGVILFFVLSGFLIAHRYMQMQHSSWRNFLVNRIVTFPVFKTV